MANFIQDTYDVLTNKTKAELFDNEVRYPFEKDVWENAIELADKQFNMQLQQIVQQNMGLSNEISLQFTAQYKQQILQTAIGIYMQSQQSKFENIGNYNGREEFKKEWRENLVKLGEAFYERFEEEMSEGSFKIPDTTQSPSGIIL